MTGAQDSSKSSRLPLGDLLDCDIVMAGGVASGIVYPGAVAKIAERYSFQSIGGTSVGALAAAVTAAAEYGRRTKNNPKAFDEIRKFPESLADEGRHGHTRLFHLFTPEPETKPLMTMAAAFSTGGAIRILWAMLSASWLIVLAVLLAFAAGALLVDRVGSYDPPAVVVVAWLASLAFVIVVGAGAWALLIRYKWLPAWRTNNYGFCTGNSSPKNAERPDQLPFEGLTPWMHRTIQTAAGLPLDGDPLTFSDLWNAPAWPAYSVDMKSADSRRSIDLAMIASDISRQRTVQIPFMETPSPLYVKLDDLEKYFPPKICDWMKAKAGDPERERIDVPDCVIRLPKPEDLPIVFGARLSLSFPFLLSAVPLMTPDFAKGKSANGRVGLRRVWLSDGGLTSNFPIHFFDMPIPSRPTFCLNLVSFESEAPSTDIQPNGVSESADDTTEEKTGHAIAEARSPERTKEKRPPDTKYDEPNPGDKVWEFVSMSRGNLFSPVPFTAFDEAPGTGLISFAKTLVNTARHWSDNQLLIAPGVRDRVVHVALRDDEGGLNLDMKADIIADLDLRGRAAGLLIAARFDPSETIDPETGNTNVNAFANHRWVRFRSFMAAFEDMSRRFASSRDNSDRAAAVRKESPLYLMISGSAKEKLGYPAPQGTRDYYKTFTSAFEKLARDMAAATRNDPHASFDVKGATSSSGAAPRPKMRLTLRPLASKDPRAEHSDLPGTPKT